MVQGKKHKIDFQDGGHLGFRDGTVLAIYDLHVAPILPTNFPVNWPFDSGEEAHINFQDGGHLGFPIRTILAIFDLQVSPNASYKVLSQIGPGVLEE